MIDEITRALKFARVHFNDRPASKNDVNNSILYTLHPAGSSCLIIDTPAGWAIRRGLRFDGRRPRFLRRDCISDGFETLWKRK